MVKSNGVMENMQTKIKEIRALFHITISKFADMLGVTRQTIYNIENFRTKLTKTQFLAICAIICKLLDEHPEKEKDMKALWERDFEKIQQKDIIKLRLPR